MTLRVPRGTRLHGESGRCRRRAKRGLRREERLWRKNEVNEDPDRLIDGRSEVIRDAGGGPGDPRPVTEDAVQRAIAVRRVGAADTVRRRIVRHDNRADRIVTVVPVRHRRPDAERNEREQRRCADRSGPGAEPLQHRDPACHSPLDCVKTRTLEPGDGCLGAVALAKAAGTLLANIRAWVCTTRPGRAKSVCRRAMRRWEITGAERSFPRW